MSIVGQNTTCRKRKAASSSNNSVVINISQEAEEVTEPDTGRDAITFLQLQQHHHHLQQEEEENNSNFNIKCHSGSQKDQIADQKPAKMEDDTNSPDEEEAPQQQQSSEAAINGGNQEDPDPDPEPEQRESCSSSPLHEIPVQWPANGGVTVQWVHALGQILEWASRNLNPQELCKALPVAVIDNLVMAASKILHKEPNCLQINVSQDDGCSVVVVGDLHGQLHDLLFLFADAGYPGNDRLFVFNGDYVDRGAWGLETFLFLLAWKVALPHRVFLLRGNHESKFCTSVYGFEQEVKFKYEDKGKHIYHKCLGCFEGLPLASIISGSVFTAHGGLFRSLESPVVKRSKGKKGRKLAAGPDPKSLKLGSLDELAKARRGVLDPPWQGMNLIPGDVLWSDPSTHNGLSPNKERGIGLLWGPDCTEEFLKKNHLKLIIRSHEGPDAREKHPDLQGMQKGYTIDHVVDSGKLITVFSAPDYPQFQATTERYNNRGAYITLEPPDFANPVFHTFEAVQPRPKVKAFYDYENVIDSDEDLDLGASSE